MAGMEKIYLYRQELTATILWLRKPLELVLLCCLDPGT